MRRFLSVALPRPNKNLPNDGSRLAFGPAVWTRPTCDVQISRRSAFPGGWLAASVASIRKFAFVNTNGDRGQMAGEKRTVLRTDAS